MGWARAYRESRLTQENVRCKRHRSEDAAANPNASVAKRKSRGPLRTGRFRQVFVEVVRCSWELTAVARPKRFALEDPSTKVSMISFPSPPALDELLYVSEWATASRVVTGRIQVGVRVGWLRSEYSGTNRTILCKISG